MDGHNINIVCDLYKAFATRDTDTVHRLLPPNIDWWFHGPPAHKYNLMQLLTGSCVVDDADTFKPLVIVDIGSMVVVEGYHIQEKVKTCWVHAWTVENGRIITQVREYLNTCVSIFHLRKCSNAYMASPQSPKCKNVWESVLADNDSMPHLLLML